MTMSDQTGVRPAQQPAAGSRRSPEPDRNGQEGRRRQRARRGCLAWLTLFAVAIVAQIPAQTATAGGPRPAPTQHRPQAAITAAYTQAFTGGQDPAYALAAVEDGPALAGTLQQAMQNFPQATSTAQVTVSDIRFQGPRTAGLRFHVVYQGGVDFGVQNGTAVISDGRWKVSRETYCTVMSWAGAICPAKAGRQPRDVAAARSAVQQAYAQAFTSGQDPAYSLAAVEAGPSLAGTLEQAIQNFPTATSTATVTTRDIVFTDPRHASLRYEITYQGGVTFGLQTGKAVISEGRWKVSRETYCHVMGWAGAVCPAP
ncbi:hypothetical protein [Frankia sp. CcI49]|uniref:hypothetical protein n=1 Tax=Frankia sp. CcI49 TaxID=1745382 RepID=UPI000976FACC|nr:hypothetical protein [Frankia sp. CcI49]